MEKIKIKSKTHKTTPNVKDNELIKQLVLNGNLDLQQLIDIVIELNGFIGVGLISFGDNLKDYCYNKIK